MPVDQKELLDALAKVKELREAQKAERVKYDKASLDLYEGVKKHGYTDTEVLVIVGKVRAHALRTLNMNKDAAK